MKHLIASLIASATLMAVSPVMAEQAKSEKHNKATVEKPAEANIYGAGTITGPVSLISEEGAKPADQESATPSPPASKKGKVVPSNLHAIPLNMEAKRAEPANPAPAAK